MKLSNKNKTFKNILIVLTIISIIFAFVLLKFNNNLSAKERLIPEISLIEKQQEIDKTIDTNGYNINKPKIILNPYEISPLTALILFETENNVSPTITIKSKDNSKDIVFNFEKAKKHALPVYGLYPNHNNEVIVTINNNDYAFKIQTEKLPDDFQNVTKELFVDKSKIDYLNEDFYFVTPASKGYTAAYDVDGKVRWYLTEKLVWEIDRLNNGNLLLSSERIINPPYYTTGLYELSPLGKIYKEYILPGGYHHDYFELENENLIVASNDFENDTVEDVIVEIDHNTGNINKKIDLKDILPTDEGKSENWLAYDWFHNNSTFYDKDTNSLTLSGRHQDIVINIDYNNLEINYIIGNPENFSKDMQKYFLSPTNELEWQYSQHAAKVLPNNHIFIFDNGNNRSKNPDEYLDAKDNYSRGVIYDVNQKDMTISQVYQYGKERGSDYYSSYISDVDYLNDNHYLIHSGGVAFNGDEVLNQPPGLSKADKLRSYTTEVMNDEKIFELSLDNNNYRAKKMSIYSENECFRNVTANCLGSLARSKVDKVKYGLLFNTHENEEIFDEYDIDIKKEKDRLIVSGKFTPEDKVNLILYNNFKSKIYNLRVSERPYTAMCLDIFNEAEKINIDKCINDQGLNGEFTLYLEINQKIYKTNKLINFD